MTQRRGLIAARFLTPIIAKAAPLRTAFDEASGAMAGPMNVHLHRPTAWQPGGKVVVAMHGMGRNADGYRDAWIANAETHGFLLVWPEFLDTKFPGAERYNDGNARAPVAEWSFPALDRAVDAPPQPFALYGHSAGA